MKRLHYSKHQILVASKPTNYQQFERPSLSFNLNITMILLWKWELWDQVMPGTLEIDKEKSQWVSSYRLSITQTSQQDWKKRKTKRIVTDLWSSISLISEIGSLKKTGRGPPSSRKSDKLLYFLRANKKQMPNCKEWISKYFLNKREIRNIITNRNSWMQKGPVGGSTSFL